MIGLDIGTNLIKVVELSESSDGKIKLVNIGREEISTENAEELEPEKKLEVTKSAIKRLFAARDFKSKKVAVSLAGDEIVIRYVKFPHMSKEELKSAIKYEAEQYIPFNIDEVVLDFQILGEETVGTEKKLDCILIAVKEIAVSKMIKLVESVGLEPSVIDCDVFAIQNAYETNYGVKENETVALINIGAKITSLNIFEDGITRFTRDIPFGGNIFTKDISREFKIDFISSEKLKRESAEIIIESEEVELTRIPDKEDKSFKVYESIISDANKLVAEVRRSFDFYEAQTKKRIVSKVFLSGGGSMIKNLDKFFTEKLKVAVEYHDPFIKAGDKVDVAPIFTVGFGLAIRGIKSHHPK